MIKVAPNISGQLKNRAWITGIRMGLAALICLAVYNYYDLQQGYWSVVTVAAILRPGLSATFSKALLRLLGTLTGAIIGYYALNLFGYNPVALFIVFLIFTTVSSYVSLQTIPYNYYSVVTGFTAAIVIASGLLATVDEAAIYRTIEVILGIVVLAGVDIFFSFLLPYKNTLYDKHLFTEMNKVFRKIHWSRQTLHNALAISLTASLSFLSWLIFKYPQGVWMTITVFLIMEDSIDNTKNKGLLRLLSQLTAACSCMALSLFFGNELITLSAVIVGLFFLCGVLIGSEHEAADMGNTIAIAAAVMLLVGQGHIDLALARFINVTAGIVLAFLGIRLFPKILSRIF